jgi:hypothetical protein
LITTPKNCVASVLDALAAAAAMSPAFEEAIAALKVRPFAFFPGMKRQIHPQ